MDDYLSIALRVGLASIAVFLTALYFVKRSKKRTVLDPSQYREFQLAEKTPVSHNTAIYRFRLPNVDDSLGLPIGQHISVSAEINGKSVQRSYTPITLDQDQGYFELMIKSYPAGNVSKRIGELQVGDSISVRGPKGNFLYEPNMVAELGMIAGGTGVTPMLQIIKAVLYNPQDKTSISLIFANVEEKDILLRDELDKLVQMSKGRLRVYYVLNVKPSEEWTGGVGFVTGDMIKEHCPPPGPSMKLLLCGPPPMIKALSEITEQVGFDKPRAISKQSDMVYKF